MVLTTTLHFSSIHFVNFVIFNFRDYQQCQSKRTQSTDAICRWLRKSACTANSSAFMAQMFFPISTSSTSRFQALNFQTRWDLINLDFTFGKFFTLYYDSIPRSKSPTSTFRLQTCRRLSSVLFPRLLRLSSSSVPSRRLREAELREDSTRVKMQSPARPWILPFVFTQRLMGETVYD